LSSEPNPNVKNNDADTIQTSPKKLSLPTNKVKRFNAVNAVAGRICDMAKHDAEVFKMVMPQLQQMYQNCMLMRDTKSKKAKAAKMAISDAQTQLHQKTTLGHSNITWLISEQLRMVSNFLLWYLFEIIYCKYILY